MIQIALSARFLDPFGLPFKKALYGPKTQGSPGPYFYTGTFDLYPSRPTGQELSAPLATFQAATWPAIINGHLACLL